MATITYQLTAKDRHTNIYIRLSINRNNVFRTPTPFLIHSNDWSTNTKLPKQNNASLKQLTIKLKQLQSDLLERYNDAVSDKTTIDKHWLDIQIDDLTREHVRVTTDKLCEIIKSRFQKEYDKGNTIDANWLNAEFESIQEQIPNLNLKPIKTDLIKCFRTEKVETIINAEWFDTFFSELDESKKQIDLNRFIHYVDVYIKNKQNNVGRKGKKGVSKSDLNKYNILKNKVCEYEKAKNKKLYFRNVNLEFRDSFIDYLRDVDQLSENYIGRLIGYFKTVCNDAKANGIDVHYQVDKIKRYSEKADIVYLTLDEIEKIEQTQLPHDYLDNARDWLVLGCYIGQRVSDLLNLTSSNVCFRNGIELIELQQQKTKKLVAIPVHPKVKELLQKRNGNFPRKISDQKLNEYIKEVAKLTGLNTPTKGAKIVDKTNRKEKGIFEKWELVTSHICRRSFASNHYGEIPTALLMSITGHSTEQQFLDYIGKTSTDHVQQIAEYFAKSALLNKKEPHLHVIKKAE